MVQRVLRDHRVMSVPLVKQARPVPQGLKAHRAFRESKAFKAPQALRAMSGLKEPLAPPAPRALLGLKACKVCRGLERQAQRVPQALRVSRE